MQRTLPDILGPFYRGPANGYSYPQHTYSITPNWLGGNLWLNVLIEDAATGARIHFASVEVWQADRNGVYDLSNQRPPDTPVELWPNTGFYRGRFTPYGAEHQRTLYTDIPGSYYQPPVGNTPGFQREPHIHFCISKAGYETLTTQIFFPRDPNLPPSADPYYIPQNTVQNVRVIHGITQASFVFKL